MMDGEISVVDEYFEKQAAIFEAERNAKIAKDNHIAQMGIHVVNSLRQQFAQEADRINENLLKYNIRLQSITANILQRTGQGNLEVNAATGLLGSTRFKPFVLKSRADEPLYEANFYGRNRIIDPSNLDRELIGTLLTDYAFCCLRAFSNLDVTSSESS